MTIKTDSRYQIIREARAIAQRVTDTELEFLETFEHLLTQLVKKSGVTRAVKLQAMEILDHINQAQIDKIKVLKQVA